MKQGKTLQKLGRELLRQRLNRQDFLTDTRSLEVKTNSCGSTLHLSLDGKPLSFTVGETAHQQIAGFVVSNSEVGLGSLRVEPLVLLSALLLMKRDSC